MVLRRDKECPFSGITNSSSLEEGAKKRFLECDKDLMYVLRKACLLYTSDAADES